MTKLIVWLKNLSIIKKVGIALAVILVLFAVAGMANLGKFSEKPGAFKTKQPIKLERDKSVKKGRSEETRRRQGGGKEAENQAASENTSKAEQSPAQSQNQTNAEQPPAQSQSQATSESQTQPAPSNKTSPKIAPTPETPSNQPSTSGVEDDDDSSSPSEANLVGSIKTMIYHTPDCPLAKKIPPDEQIWFSTPDEALDLEYNPCTMCATPN